MSEKIKIDSIKIENYRQYSGNHNIRFSNRDDGFSVIVGENGAGKSNLLNAINWCFYQKEPHTKNNKGYGIINKEYLEGIESGNVASMAVQVEIHKGDDQYRISRILKVIKNEYEYETIDSKNKILRMTEASGYPLPAGCEVIEKQSTFEILIKKKHEQDFHLDKSANADILMNEILPESLSSYFILDGEFLEKFWSGIQKVQIGIEQISQIHLLTSTIEHLNTFKKNVPTIGDKDIDNLTTKIRQSEYIESSQDIHGNITFSNEPRYSYDPEVDDNEYYHATGNPRIKDIEEDIKKIESDLNEITEKFGASNIESVNLLNEEQKYAKNEYIRLARDVKQKEKTYFTSMIEHIPLYFLKPATEYTIQQVDELREKGELPYEAKKIFTNDLLDRGTCICHTNLKSEIINDEETNSARVEVIKVRDSMAEDQGLDGSVEMKFYFEERLLGDFDKFTETYFDNPRKEFSNTNNKLEECNGKLKKINIKLQNLGNLDIEELAKNHKHLMQLMREKGNEISDIRYKLKDNNIAINDLKAERKKLLGKNLKSKRIAHDQEVWETISNILEKTHSELKQEIKNEVQEKTMEIFLKTMYKENLFKQFIIKDNFDVELIDKDDESMLASLSAGESLFLALSFISAIRNVTGFKFPLIIDTPLGRVSGTPRYLLSQALPKYLPDEQIIFLATDTEFLNPDPNVHDKKERSGLAFGQLLEEQIKVRYYLIKGMEHNTARIEDYEPKWSKS